MATGALVNLCNHSDDIKEIFYQKEGPKEIIKFLNETKDEELLINILKLILSFTSNSEVYSRKITKENNY